MFGRGEELDSKMRQEAVMLIESGVTQEDMTFIYESSENYHLFSHLSPDYETHSGYSWAQVLHHVMELLENIERMKK